MFSIIWGASDNVRANHIAAAHITYKYAGPNKYIVTVSVFRDCRDGNGVLPSITINYKSASCDTSSVYTLDHSVGKIDSLTGLLKLGSGKFTNLECLGITTCVTGQSGYAVEEFVYQDTITLPVDCNDWIISYETDGKRNTNDVIMDATNKKIYVSALLNNKEITAPVNNSPAYANDPVAVFCVGKPFFFDQSAIENDGDSLVYSFAPAQGANGDTLIYTLPYKADSAISVTSSGIKIDPMNGIISFTPTNVQTSVFCILIQEYRYISGVPVLIGSVKNDMQVFVTDNCIPDTLNFIGDTTAPTGIHPSISAFCLDTQVVVTLDHNVQCETVQPDGSDFRMWNSLLGNIKIKSAEILNCAGGLSNKVKITLSDSIVVNGSYFIKDTIGSDGNPLLGECGRPLSDTLEIIVADCIQASVDLMNVTVENCDDIIITWRTLTENLPLNFFTGYYVFRTTPAGGTMDTVGVNSNINDTVLYDLAVDTEAGPYYYKVRMLLNTALESPFSDSIRNIFLSASENTTDSTLFNLSWTPYEGWNTASVRYSIMESLDKINWKEKGATYFPAYQYKKPLLAHKYWLRIETRDINSSMISRSNCIEFEISPRQQPPNVITPNGDGINETFFVNDLLIHETAHFKVYNRWGVKVYEDKDYQNNWSGTGWLGSQLIDGTYFYILTYEDGTVKNGFITILK